jgi:hypothetical protein
VIATHVSHEPLNRRFLKVEGKAPYGDRAIVDVLSAEPLSIQIPKGQFLSDWFEFAAPMVDGRDTVVSLQQIDVVPDYNRDGKIDQADREKVAVESPWRFWINDDDDSGETGGTDVSVDSDALTINPDWWSSGVDGIRDLIDFFPLRLDFGSVLTVMPETKYQYFLKHKSQTPSSDGEDAVPSFSVLWFPEAVPEDDSIGETGAGSYFKNLD